MASSTVCTQASPGLPGQEVQLAQFSSPGVGSLTLVLGVNGHSHSWAQFWLQPVFGEESVRDQMSQRVGSVSPHLFGRSL